jgi:hypothetical protein
LGKAQKSAGAPPGRSTRRISAKAATIDAGPAKVDRKQFRRVVECVVLIRDHQLEPDRRLRNEGVGREKVSRAYRPKTREERWTSAAASSATASSAASA